MMRNFNITDENADNISQALIQFANSVEQYTLPYKKLKLNIEQFQPVLDTLKKLSLTVNAAKKLADVQFVLIDRVSFDFVNRTKDEDINKLAEEFLITDELIVSASKLSALDTNRVFQQSIQAFYKGAYDLAIIGLTAVLDKLLSEHSGEITKVNIKSRCTIIKKKIEDKGDDFLDELEGRDLLLYLTYPKAVELFGESSSFDNKEPDLLNRHWIMHGRSNRLYTKLDCVKVLNMIYGTVKLGQLGKEDG